LQSLFKHALNRRMKARQQGRPFPTVWRDLGEHVDASEPAWE
jgi:hypothetical protein